MEDFRLRRATEAGSGWFKDPAALLNLTLLIKVPDSSESEGEEDPQGFFDWANPPIRAIDWRMLKVVRLET